MSTLTLSPDVTGDLCVTPDDDDALQETIDVLSSSTKRLSGVHGNLPTLNACLESRRKLSLFHLDFAHAVISSTYSTNRREFDAQTTPQSDCHRINCQREDDSDFSVSSIRDACV